MKYFFAFLISILIHTSLYFYFIKSNKNIQQIKSYKNIDSNISKIQYIQLQPKVIKKNIKPKSIKKENKVKKVLKKKIVKKQKIKKITKKEVNKKAIKKETEAKPVLPKVSISDFNKKDTKKKLDKKTKRYIDLYGKDFNKFDKQTKLFLIKNIKDIGAITKRFLTYPMLSAQAGQDGLNVIEFILHPNGTIKDVMISKSSGYFMLDDNTIDTIYQAYEDYPRPNKPTLIKIFVKYELR